MRTILQVSSQKNGLIEEAMAAAAANGVTVKPAKRATTGNQLWEVLAAFREAGFLVGIREGEIVIAQGQATKAYVMAYTDKYLNQIPFFTRTWFNLESAMAAYAQAVEWAKQNTEEHGHGYHDIELSEVIDLGDGGEALGFHLASHCASSIEYPEPTAAEVKAYEDRVSALNAVIASTAVAMGARLPGLRIETQNNGPAGASAFFTAYDGDERVGELQVNTLQFEGPEKDAAIATMVDELVEDVRVKKEEHGRLRALAMQAVKQLPGDFEMKFVYGGHAQAHIEATGPGVVQAWTQFNTNYYAKLSDEEVVKDIAEQLKERLGLPHIQNKGKK